MADRILPQDISPRGDPPGERRPEHGKGWLALLVVAVLVGGGVWFYLRTPTSPEERAEPVAQDAAIEEAAQPPVETTAEAEETTVVAKATPTGEAPVATAVASEPSPAQKLLDRQRAEAALTDYTVRKRELEELAVLEWGGEAYGRILATVQAADEAYTAESFAVAADGYRDAARAARELADRAGEAFDDLVAKGDTALAEANGEDAQRYFDAALAIRPDSDAARAGQRRAGTIERTAALLESGKQHEANRLYELALIDFGEAARLDPLHEEARVAAARVRDRLQEQTFREVMSETLTALSDGRLADARTKVLQAQALRPEAPEVRDALFQITEAERTARIKALRVEAEAAVAEEDWAAAHERYREVLAIDATVAFAREGADQAAACLRIDQRIGHYLDQPSLLAAPDGRADARLVLSELAGVSVSAPRIRARAKKLEALLTAAETPVPVTLYSDGQTRVDVYQVGRFPPFQTRSLQLLPGTYTIVGYRPGFRDVRLTLDVEPGQDNAEATVQCRERI